jgi:PIN domain nuclease of toxin-antitoxin system
MMYLDTHVVVWLYAGEIDRFPSSAVKLIEENDLFISPMVLLELQYLNEIDRIKADPMLVYETLGESISLQMCRLEWSKVILGSLSQSWTRDPFDRLIATQAMVRNEFLLTKDRKILDNCPVARWETAELSGR